MNSLLNTDDTVEFVKADGEIFAAEHTLLRKVDDGISITTHSGLPLAWRQGRPIPAEPLRERPVSAATKRVFDVVCAAAALLFLAPLLVLVACAIKVSSPGPVFFVQKREGLGGRAFNILKFRTMRCELGDQSGITQTRAGDSRITPVGHVLRKTSIDELPQLINVLLGDMSVVGPRPHVPGMLANGVPYAQLVDYYDQRHVVLPGITGWAQANGYRGETTTARASVARIEHDLAYVQNFSLMLDLSIILKTIRREFLTGSGV